jgi:hypothetical protein
MTIHISPTNLKITIIDEEGKKTIKPFLAYERVTLAEDFPCIANELKELLDEFKGNVDTIILDAKLVLK